MPRSRKSKPRASGKRPQGGDETESLGVDQAAAAAAAEESTPSSPQCKGISCPGSDEASRIQDNNEAGASEAPPSNESSDTDNLSKVAQFLEHFLLYKYKKKQPILKEDMLKIIGEYYKDKFPDILKKAAERIGTIFALDVKEVDSSNHLYDLVSQLKLPNNGRVIAGRGFPKTGLLMNVLGMIFIKGNRATEEEIWELLNPMRICPGRKHCIYGEPRKLITKDFVRLQYLEYRQVPDSDPPRYEFLWGRKAHAELKKMKMLEFLAKINDTVPSAFSGYYEEA
ncbi:PREDICTED: melanoma-associated antigen B1-like, partial [Hipposideros armiger]|uniref:Melanoma-associated antigen B1-like n=1 Tax=Hipposideros armiger TaxID=186990 RepID=A0A8B7QPU9_HIPAR